MRKYVIGFAFAAGMAASLSASAQQDPDLNNDKIQQSGTDCSTTREPPSNEVWVFTDANFKGACASLTVGFYPNSGTTFGGFGLPNDSITSLKVGSGVRARLFQNGVYGGAYYWFGGGLDYPGMPSGWNDITSSIRVEDNARSTTCDDLHVGEYALFTDTDYFGDCVVLHYNRTYPEPVDLGIGNDSVSSIRVGPQSICTNGGYPYPDSVELYTDGIYQGGGSEESIMSGSAPTYLDPLESLPGFDNAISATSSFCADGIVE